MESIVFETFLARPLGKIELQRRVYSSSDHTKVVSCLMISFLHVFGQLCCWTVGLKTGSMNHRVYIGQSSSRKTLTKGSGARKGV